MIIPPLQGKLSAPDFFIFAACDEHYFDDFAPSLVNSIIKNTNHTIHLHIFNPRDDQLTFCSKKNISFTFEYAAIDIFANSARRWSTEYDQEPMQSQKLRTLTAMTKGKDIDIQDRMRKTYYACARFIRLNEISNGLPFFAMDVDAIVRKPVQPLVGKDFFLHHISGKKARFLAGGLYGSQMSRSFLDVYSKSLKQYLEDDYVYWGLDQDVLDSIVPQFNWGQLPNEYIDWEMRPSSVIWTAKGTRKDLKIFISEKQKYIS